MRPLVSATLLALACSAEPSGPGPAPPRPEPGAEPESIVEDAPTARPEGGVPDDAPLIRSATLRKTWYGKPPMVVFRFDITVENPAADPRWIVLPATFPYIDRDDPRPGDGAVAELQVFRLSAEPNVLLVQAIGSHWWAAKLTGGATLTLEGLPIDAFWSERVDSVGVEALLTPKILVGDAPLESLLQAPVVSAGGVVRAPKDVGDDRTERFWHPPEGADDPPVTFGAGVRHTVQVKLSGG